MQLVLRELLPENSRVVTNDGVK